MFRMETSPVRKFETKVGKNVKKKKRDIKLKARRKSRKGKSGTKFA